MPPPQTQVLTVCNLRVIAGVRDGGSAGLRGRGLHGRPVPPPPSHRQTTRPPRAGLHAGCRPAFVTDTDRRRHCDAAPSPAPALSRRQDLPSSSRRPLLPLMPSTLGGRGPAPTLFDWCLLSFGPAELGPAQAERLYPVLVWPTHPPRSHYLCTSYRLRAAAYHSVPACLHELPRITWPPCRHHSRRHSPAS